MTPRGAFILNPMGIQGVLVTINPLLHNFSKIYQKVGGDSYNKEDKSLVV
jgi:hypothetical protein